MKVDDYADKIRLLIEHENNLENNRIQWMLVIQGFLLAAFGTTLNSSFPNKIVFVFSVIGFITSLSTYAHLLQSRKAMNNAYEDFKSAYPNYNGPPVIGLEMSKLPWYKRYIIPPYILPVLFMLIWMVLPLLINVWN